MENRDDLLVYLFDRTTMNYWFLKAAELYFAFRAFNTKK